MTQVESSVNPLKGDLGVVTCLSSTKSILGEDGIPINDIHLGGTVAMVIDPATGKLNTISDGAFAGSEQHTFNDRKLLYSGGHHLEPRYSRKSVRLTQLPSDIRKARDTIEGRQRLTQGIWTAPLSGHYLRPGMHTPAELANGDISSRAYLAARMSRKLTSGKYPEGISLDSNDIWAKGNFPAVLCSYVIPKIDRSIKEQAQKENITYEEAMRNAIFVVPGGTDREVEVNTVLDLIGFFSGITFITVGANSSFGTPKGDAEANLGGVETVVRAIYENKLSRGKAYAIADNLVMWDLIDKMHPDERGLRRAIKGPDGYYYGGTFQSYFAIPLEKLKRKKSDADIAPSYNPRIFYSLIPFPGVDFERRIFCENAAAKSLNFAYAQGAVFRCDVQDIPSELPLGTKVWIIEGSGEANGPDYAVAQMKRTMDHLSKRTQGRVRPTVIVTSSAGFPYVGDAYTAGLWKGLMDTGEKVVRGKTLTPKTLEVMSTLLLNSKMGDSLSTRDEVLSQIKLEPYELEEIIDAYGLNRNLPHFKSSQFN